MDLSVVIPVHNEAGNIVSVVEDVCSVLDGRIEYEVLVVDDGSTDSTAAMLQSCRARRPRLRVFRYPRRAGQSAALASGIAAARALWVATLDGDGQNDPADILKLYRELEHSSDRVMLVTGYRLQRRDDWVRRASSAVARALRRLMLDDVTPDSGCGLKLFPRDVFGLLPQFDHMHRFLPALVQRAGGEVLSVEVRHIPRRYGESKYGVMNRLWVGIVDLCGVWWLRRRTLQDHAAEIE